MSVFLTADKGHAEDLQYPQLVVHSSGTFPTSFCSTCYSQRKLPIEQPQRVPSPAVRTACLALVLVFPSLLRTCYMSKPSYTGLREAAVLPQGEYARGGPTLASVYFTPSPTAVSMPINSDTRSNDHMALKGRKICCTIYPMFIYK